MHVGQCVRSRRQLGMHLRHRCTGPLSSCVQVFLRRLDYITTSAAPSVCPIAMRVPAQHDSCWMTSRCKCMHGLSICGLCWYRVHLWVVFRVFRVSNTCCIYMACRRRAKRACSRECGMSVIICPDLHVLRRSAVHQRVHACCKGFGTLSSMGVPLCNHCLHVCCLLPVVFVCGSF